jgi:putative Holliday junction resolvase
MRILGIDPGDRRVGLAVSDELGITAQGLETFDRRTGDILDHLGTLIGQYAVERVVVGYPVTASGQPGDSSRKAQKLASAVKSRFGVEVVLWDERYSSSEARRVLRGTRAPKPAVDRVAAVLILQSYLDSLAGK